MTSAEEIPENAPPAKLPRTPLRADTRYLIIGEGKDELHFVSELTRSFLDSEKFQASEIGGKTLLRYTLPAIMEDPRFKSLECIAILRDADDDARAAFDSVRNVVVAAGLEPPMRHGGFSAGIPRVGIFILPDGSNPGMIETLCVQSLEGVPGKLCIESFLDCTREQGITVEHRDKAAAYSWLAIQREAGKSVGIAAKSGYWHLEHPVFQPLTAFLRAMAG